MQMYKKYKSHEHFLDYNVYVNVNKQGNLHVLSFQNIHFTCTYLFFQLMPLIYIGTPVLQFFCPLVRIS